MKLDSHFRPTFEDAERFFERKIPNEILAQNKNEIITVVTKVREEDGTIKFGIAFSNNRRISPIYMKTYMFNTNDDCFYTSH